VQWPETTCYRGGVLVPGDVVLGKLKIIRVLGAGAMGKVYEVEHLMTLHRRALKVINEGVANDDEALVRLQREASAAGRTGDPHIVETLDAGRLEDGSIYLLMEKLEGEPLDVVLSHGPLPVGAAAFLVAEAARGLEAAHRKGLVHRDIKPANLFLTWQGDVPLLKVLDFGLSKIDPSLGGLAVTQSGTTLGTPLYMSPEQMRGARHVDARTDVYALGVVLYESLAGTRPYEADSFADLAALVVAGKPPPLDKAIPAALQRVVERAMAASLTDRIPTAGAFADALAPFSSLEAVRDLRLRADGLGSTFKRQASIPPARRRLTALTLSISAAAGVGLGVLAVVAFVKTRPPEQLRITVATSALERPEDASVAQQTADAGSANLTVPADVPTPPETAQLAVLEVIPDAGVRTSAAKRAPSRQPKKPPMPETPTPAQPLTTPTPKDDPTAEMQ
jgi:eukaryotic-like serine/threonine-protein kinase